MATLHVEQKVSDFDAFKRMFDSDPADRKGSGVTSFRMSRAADDPNHVLIDMELDSVESAKALLGKLTEVWKSPQASALLTGTPQATVTEVVETKTLG
jgi:ribosomal protein L35AE/L33A